MVHGKPATDHTEEKISSLTFSRHQLPVVLQLGIVLCYFPAISFWNFSYSILCNSCASTATLIHVLKGHIVNLPSEYLCSESQTFIALNFRQRNLFCSRQLLMQKWIEGQRVDSKTLSIQSKAEQVHFSTKVQGTLWKRKYGQVNSAKSFHHDIRFAILNSHQLIDTRTKDPKYQQKCNRQ